MSKTESSVRGPQAGNIVFSKVPIEPANPTQVTGEFKTDDPIYAAAYLGKSIRTLSGNLQVKKGAIF